MNNIQTEILINAPIEHVWTIFTDFQSYPDWNPFIRSLEGSVQEGSRIKAILQPPGSKGMTFKPVVLDFKAPNSFRWKGKLLITGLFDGEHYFILEELPDNTTRFIQGEKFTGILVGLMKGVLQKTKIGFRNMNEALKGRCEKLK